LGAGEDIEGEWWVMIGVAEGATVEPVDAERENKGKW